MNFPPFSAIFLRYQSLFVGETIIPRTSPRRKPARASSQPTARADDTRRGKPRGSHTPDPRFTRVLESIPFFCFVLDESGTILSTNSAVMRSASWKPEDLHGKLFVDFLSPNTREVFRVSLKSFPGRDKPSPVEVRFQGNAKEGIDLSLFLSSYRPDGKTGPTYILATARDISEEKRRELDFLRFYNLAHYTVNPLEITDPDGKIIYVNPAFERASGYAKEEMIGKNPNVFGSGKHPKSFWMKMWQTIKAGKVWMGEIENRRRSGEPFHTQLLISPILDNGGKIVGYLGIHRDITEQKSLEKQLIHAQKMESIGLLTAGIAHEVGNPLTSISSLVQVIERSTDDEFTKDQLELIKSQVTRISRIIRDLVDFSRRSSYEIQLTDINNCVQEAIAIVKVARKAKSISFTTALDPKLPLIATVPDQIQQVVLNVLINAVDAVDDRFQQGSSSPEMGGRGEVHCATFIRDDDLCVQIMDNGRGIPEENLTKIFEPFFTTKKVGEGTGLGLWVSFGIIRSFQGEIKAESRVGEGTTFTLSLPLHTDLR